MSDNKNQALFSVIFEDKTSFVGGNNYRNTKWMDIPTNKKIKRIFYRLPDGNYLCLGDYEEYFHMIEATRDWMRVSKNKIEKLNSSPKVEYAYIMGKRGKKITSYRITLFSKKNDRYKLGDIVRREFDFDSRFIKGLNKSIWRG